MIMGAKKIEDLIKLWEKKCKGVRLTDNTSLLLTQILTKMCGVLEVGTEKLFIDPMESDDYNKSLTDMYKVVTSNREFMRWLVGTYLVKEEFTSVSMRILCTVVLNKKFDNVINNFKITADGMDLLTFLIKIAVQREEPRCSYAYAMLSRAMDSEHLLEVYLQANIMLISILIQDMHVLKGQPDPGRKKYYCLDPITKSTQQVFRLRFLIYATHNTELRELMIKLGLMDLLLYYCDFDKTQDFQLTNEGMQLLSCLLYRLPQGTEFVERGGIQKILHTPNKSAPMSFVAGIFAGGFMTNHMRFITCHLPYPIVMKIVSYLLSALDITRLVCIRYATLALVHTVGRPLLLKVFDELYGLIVVFEWVKKELEYVKDFEGENENVTVAIDVLERYLCHHVSLKAHEWKCINAKSTGERPPDPIQPDEEFSKELGNFYDDVDLLHQEGALVGNWEVVRQFHNLNMIKYLLNFLIATAHLKPQRDAKNFFVKINNIFEVLCCSHDVIQLLSEPIRSTNHAEGILILCGINMFIMQVGQKVHPTDNKQRYSALAVITQCVCYSKAENTIKKVKFIKHTVRQCLRLCNGLQVILSVLTQPNDYMWWSACKALIGMVYNDEVVANILKPMPLFNGLLQEMLKNAEKGQYENSKKLFTYGSKLLKIVTGKEFSRNANVEKMEIVSKTNINYSETELLELIHEHLQVKGLSKSAESLLQEGKLNCVIMETCKSQTTAGNDIADLYNSASQSTAFTKWNCPGNSKIKLKWRSTDEVSNSPSLSSEHTDSGKHGKESSTPLEEQPIATTPLEKQPTLDKLMVDYLEEQHSHCETPMSARPKFSLIEPHSCQKPQYKWNAPYNVAHRRKRMEVFMSHGGVHGKSYDKQIFYGRMRVIKTVECPEDIGFSQIKFRQLDSPSNPRIQFATCEGRLSLGSEFLNSMFRMSSFLCHNCPITSFSYSKDNQMMISSGAWGTPRTCLWHCLLDDCIFLAKHHFNHDSHMEFSQSNDKLVGTRGSNAVIYDTATYKKIVELRPGVLKNIYKNNQAKFDHSDKLVLSNGILWDVRSGAMIHKFDKIGKENGCYGRFHQKGLHLLINNVMWDMRTFKLMKIIEDMEKCCEIMKYTSDGDILFGATPPAPKPIKVFTIEPKPQPPPHYMIRTFDAEREYKTITTVDTRWGMNSIDLDPADCYLAISAPTTDVDDIPYKTLCRVYEIGRGSSVDPADECIDYYDEEYMPVGGPIKLDRTL